MLHQKASYILLLILFNLDPILLIQFADDIKVGPALQLHLYFRVIMRSLIIIVRYITTYFRTALMTRCNCAVKTDFNLSIYISWLCMHISKKKLKELPYCLRMCFCKKKNPAQFKYLSNQTFI